MLYMPGSPKSPQASYGFTLIEMLVAISVLAVVGVLSWRGLDSMQLNSAYLSHQTARWQEISHAIEHFGRAVSQPAQRLGKKPDGHLAPAFWGRPASELQQQTALLVFSKRGQANSDSERLGYFWHNQQLNLLTWHMPEAATLPQGVHRLLGGVEWLELMYMDKNAQWHNQWPTSGDKNPLEAPRAVSLRLRLVEGVQIRRIFDLR